MSRVTYVLRNGELVEKRYATPIYSQQNHAQSDIKPFRTQDGTEITSRSALRSYERSRGVRQVGTDWEGPQYLKDLHKERMKGSKEEPR